MKRVCLILLFMMVILPIAASPVYADSLGLIARGVGKLIGSPFLIPGHMLTGATRAFPFGLLTGAVTGTAGAVSGILTGGLDVARGAAPYAKYAIFFI